MARSVLAVWLVACALAAGGCRSYGPPAGEKWRLFWLGTPPARELDRLQSPDPEVRRLAVIQLGRIGGPDHAPPVAEHLYPDAEPARLVRVAAAAALRALGSPVVRGDLVAALHEPDPFVRAEAARSLGVVGSADEVPALAAVLSRDMTGDVRIQAAYALGRLGEDDAVPALVAALDDPHESVAFAAHWSLVAITNDDHPPTREAWRDALPDESP
jgi:HEAT repeat protein